MRRGHIEAAIVALPDDDLVVRPIGQFEHVYISSDPTHLTAPVTARVLAEASLVLPRVLLNRRVPGLGPAPSWVSLDPPLYVTVAIVHRRDARISAGNQLMIELATRRVQELLALDGRSTTPR